MLNLPVKHWISAIRIDSMYTFIFKITKSGIQAWSFSLQKLSKTIRKCTPPTASLRCRDLDEEMSYLASTWLQRLPMIPGNHVIWSRDFAAFQSHNWADQLKWGVVSILKPVVKLSIWCIHRFSINELLIKSCSFRTYFFACSCALILQKLQNRFHCPNQRSFEQQPVMIMNTSGT